jgi:hypothetical protein
MTKLQIGIIRLDFPDNPEEESKDYVTCLSTERLSRYAGIPSEGIIGQILRPLGPGERITPGNFAANGVFVDLMQGMIASRGPQTKDLIAEAQRLGEGTLYVIDRRTRAPEGPVREILEQDIFGEFDVKKGRIVPGSYRPNAKHYILTEDGFFQLGPHLEEFLLEVLGAIPDPDDEAESHSLPN